MRNLTKPYQDSGHPHFGNLTVVGCEGRVCEAARASMTAGDDAANELTARLAISPQAIKEAIRRGLLTFVRHRNCRSWRFGDSRNGSFRRIDGEPFRINCDCVKAEAETRETEWHRLIGIDDAVANDRRDVLLIPEGSKDALAALHFADAEGTLERIGVVAALGAGVVPLAEDIEHFRGRRVRIIGDVDEAGVEAATRIGKSLAPVAEDVQVFSLAELHRDDGSQVKDLFDLSRIDYDDFESNRDLWSITDLDSKRDRTTIISDKHEFFPSPLFPPHGSPESHGFHVYPVSNPPELEEVLEELAARNACTEHNTAKQRRWQLARDLIAVEKRIGRKLNPGELMRAFNHWYETSLPHLDPKKSWDDYCGAFLAELGKVRVPTGGGETLKTALARISVSVLPEIPGRPDAPASWRYLAALHRELSRQSGNGTYFLSCRNAAQAHPSLNKDSANKITWALVRLGMISIVRVGGQRPGAKASEFRYLPAGKV